MEELIELMRVESILEGLAPGRWTKVCGRWVFRMSDDGYRVPHVMGKVRFTQGEAARAVMADRGVS